MNNFDGPNISAGATAIIIVAAVAVLVGFMTLICTAINFAKNRSRARRLQSLSPVRIVTPAECIAQNRRLPFVTNSGAPSMMHFIPSVPGTPCEPGSPKPQSPKMFCIAPDAPPTYEEALQMAIEESSRITSQANGTHIPVLNEANSNPTTPVAELASSIEAVNAIEESENLKGTQNSETNKQTTTASFSSKIISETINVQPETTTLCENKENTSASTSQKLDADGQRISGTPDNQSQQPKQKSFEEVAL